MGPHGASDEDNLLGVALRCGRLIVRGRLRRADAPCPPVRCGARELDLGRLRCPFPQLVGERVRLTKPHGELGAEQFELVQRHGFRKQYRI